MKNIVEKLHQKRLEEKGIVIEEIYKNEKDNTIFIRTSDGKECDNFSKCPKIERNYYVNDKLLYRETKFDKSILYSFNRVKTEKEKCTECGYEALATEFYDGCPYCGSQFNIDYTSTNKISNGINKKMFSTKNCIIMLLIVLLVSTLFTFIMYKTEKETITALDLISTFILVAITTWMPVISIFFVVALFATKDFPNTSIIINGCEISNSILLKDLQSELKKYYYHKNPIYKNLIDYEIIEYTNYEVGDNYIEPKIHFTLKIREYFLEDNKIRSQMVEKKLSMKGNNAYQQKQQKMDKCPKCGASIIGVFDRCSYCNEKQIPNKLWLLDKVL